MPQRFYEIPCEKWLFKDHPFVKPDDPEERVRQWALFELLSTYGILINNIEVEQKVKVGSKTYRADIVIYREQRPHILIECKRQEYRHINKGLEQAISYANFLKTKFVVITNGTIWQVRRYVDDKWVPVPDIETRADEKEEEDFIKLIELIETLKPAVYWLHRSVPAEDAQKFLASLQYLFVSHASFFEDVHVKLVNGTDCLLSAMSSRPFSEDSYVSRKLHAANNLFQAYFKAKGFEWSFTYPEVHSTDVKISSFHYEFEKLANNLTDFENGEAWFIKLNLSLLAYFRQIRKLKRYIIIPESTIITFQHLVEPFFHSKLGVKLADELNDSSYIENYCRQAWQNFKPF